MRPCVGQLQILFLFQMRASVSVEVKLGTILITIVTPEQKKSVLSKSAHIYKHYALRL